MGDISKPDIVLLTNRRLAKKELQGAIDRAGFDIPLTLSEPEPSDPGLWQAVLAGLPTTFRFREADPREASDGVAGRGWQVAYSVRCAGKFEPTLAGFMAILAHAEATGGVFYHQEAGIMTDTAPFRDTIDGMIAALKPVAQSTKPTEDEWNWTIHVRRLE